ncbi:hypothetical protein ANCDUO_07003 [Ancylostoma duodenale]|uniref:Uncharacterized protein n=1 Tax=Ancylostoma duodenale TaxID=51022 RepID=A0A0C2GUN7_9BILA|nr:hypothetical protein ANCDUO_07003 [Ancylostoma duodenale]
MDLGSRKELGSCRLFGTYKPEREDRLGYDKGQVRDENGKEIFPGLWNKVEAAFRPPGYFPGVKTKYFFMWLYMDDNTEGIPKVSDLRNRQQRQWQALARAHVTGQFFTMKP